ncbi:CoA transferase [Phenylobacterium sp.]|uniref:CoA transferase n=1 Tax=Phenylobacterium sp. TaxID=1871053 RepID=UPI002DF1FF64|nr:CoA transferase [Phenylobacterium sp.]
MTGPIAPALAMLCGKLAELTTRFGRRVDAEALGILDRAGQLPLDPPGLASPNRACRLFQAGDGWMALNLARPEDGELIGAWLEREIVGDPWDAVAAAARGHSRAELIARASLIGLPAAAVGEVVRDSLDAPRIAMGRGMARRSGGQLKVVDLSALWAGPLCGAILAAMGARVVKIESRRRPDPTRGSTPAFFQRLNGGKAELALDLTTAQGQARLCEAIDDADVLVTSARPRAFSGLGLDPQAVFARNPGLVWTAITGYGWTGAVGERVAFGDDAAAAGGLVSWTSAGEPRFLGDALADPVTGLAAAIGALQALEAGGGLVDVSLAGSAAGAAAACEIARAA